MLGFRVNLQGFGLQWGGVRLHRINQGQGFS